MHLHFGQAREPIEQGSDAPGKTGSHFGIAAIVFTEVYGQESNLHLPQNYQTGNQHAMKSSPAPLKIVESKSRLPG